jgi:hypothetical protein
MGVKFGLSHSCKNKPMTLKNRVPKRIFGFKTDALTEGFSKPHNELCPPPAKYY